MGRATATGLASDMDHAKPTDLLLASSVSKLATELNEIYDKLSPNSTFLEEIVVLTPSLVNKYFAKDEDWEYLGWGLTTEGAKCRGDTENHLTISPRVYPKAGKGHYYLNILLDSLPSGRIDIYINDTWIRTLQYPGRCAFEIVLGTIHDKIHLVYNGGASTDQIVIKELALHYVTPTFVDYLTAKIRQLATISADEYVRKDEFEHRLSEIQNQLRELLEETTASIEEHKTAHNPHGITCEMIDAAPSDHTHSEYILQGDLGVRVRQIGDAVYSQLDHTHKEYVDREEIRDLVGSLVSGAMSDVTTLTPLTIIKAPIGKLPQRYIDTGITPAAQIIQSPGIHLHVDAPYDPSLCTVDTNTVDLIDEAPKFFSDTENYAEFDCTEPGVSFRITFHKARKIVGYTLKHTDASSVPKEWMICSDDTSFIHRVLSDKATFVDNEYTVNFEGIITANSLTFTFNAFTLNQDSTAALKVILLTENMSDVLEITSEEFTVCIPNSGANQIVKVNQAVAKVLPRSKIPGTNYYLYLRKNDDDSRGVLYWSVYPPICSDTHAGTDVLTDTYHMGATTIKPENGDVEYYSHKEYGDLRLTRGKTIDGSLINIYGSQGETWTSEGSEVIFHHDFDGVMMTGYLLAWHHDVEDIPRSWSLTLHGKDMNNVPTTILIDNVEEYYPFYSVTDDDLVYCKQFNEPFIVDHAVLAFKAKSGDNPKITLSRVSWFLAQYRYSPASNTAYLGNTTTSAACIGSAYCNADLQWEINNTYTGKCCTVPVNNLAPCSTGLYTVPNPFHTDNVTCIVRAHDFIGNSMASGAYITTVTADYITIYCALPVRCSVQVLRVW